MGLPQNTPYVLGVDVGGTKIRPGFVDEVGNIFASRKYPMDRSTMDTTLGSIRGAVIDFMAAYPDAKPLAAGFGLVGRCDTAAGMWTRAVSLPISRPVPVADETSAKLGVPVYIDNDVFCATAAELHHGAGRRYKDFLLLNVGTGLSVGIVSGGRLVRGAGNVAGEVGQCFASEGLTLEQRCSGGGIAARARGVFGDEKITAARVFELAGQGEPRAVALVEDAVCGLSAAVADLVALFDPAAVIFSGSVAAAAGVVPAVAAHVRAHAYQSSLMDLREIALSALDPTAVGLMGAARRAFEGLGR